MPAEKSAEKMLRIGDLAKKTGVSVQAIRFYEREGLLQPATRTASRYRLYTRENLRILMYLQNAQRAGATLADIKSILETRKRGMEVCRDWVEPLEKRKAEIEGKIDELRGKLDSLGKLLHARKSCLAKLASGERGNEPHICPIRLKMSGIRVQCVGGVIDYNKCPPVVAEDWPAFK